MNRKIILIFSLMFFVFVICSCKKLVEVDGPPTSVSSKNIYNNDATAVGAITSLYVNLCNGFIDNPGELISLSCMTGLSADELTYSNNVGNALLNAYYRNDLTPLNAGGGGDYWGKTYERLYVVNAAIEGLVSSNGLTPGLKQHLLGEAYFMRAFYYFYLINLYGDVALVLSTDYKTNATIKKTDKIGVYSQIIKDLKVAQSLLNEQYLKGDLLAIYPNGSEERVRPNKWAATALLARTYLFKGDDWLNAETQASLVIAKTSLYQLFTERGLNQVFLKNNREAIWQLQPTQFGFNTQEAYKFVLPAEGPSASNPVFLSKELIKDFEPADQRKIDWTSSIVMNGQTYYYPFKYKITRTNLVEVPVTEYSTVLRLAEQFLIRAEARAQQGNIKGAIDDIDQIRKRAGLALVSDFNPNISKEDLISLILKEKRIELFAEWGHRWFDLKRTGKVDEIMSKITPIKSNGGVWKSYQKNYPIWSFELQSNPNLAQISGY